MKKSVALPMRVLPLSVRKKQHDSPPPTPWHQQGPEQAVRSTSTLPTPFLTCPSPCTPRSLGCARVAGQECRLWPLCGCPILGPTLLSAASCLPAPPTLGPGAGAAGEWGGGTVMQPPGVWS